VLDLQTRGGATRGCDHPFCHAPRRTGGYLSGSGAMPNLARSPPSRGPRDRSAPQPNRSTCRR